MRSSHLPFSIIFLLSGFLPLSAQIGVPGNGLPDWYERTTYLNINAARMDPPAFGATYGKAPNPLTTYAVRKPYILHHDLNRAARYHSEDMMKCNRMSHTSCDGTSFSARLNSFIGKGGAECIASSYRTPLAAVDAWLHSDAGHRDALMNTRYTDIGCGHAQGSSHWWTADLSSLSAAQTHPAYGGSHQTIATATTDFWINYYTSSGEAPRSVTLVLENQRVPMTRILGTDGKGTYGVKSPAASSCRTYFFELIGADGAARRYPESGVFRTFGEGLCGEDFTAATDGRIAAIRVPALRPLRAELSRSTVRIRAPAPDEITRVELVSSDGRRIWTLNRTDFVRRSDGAWALIPNTPRSVYSVVVHRASGAHASTRVTIR